MRRPFLKDRGLLLRLGGTLLALVLILVLLREGGWQEILTALKQISWTSILAGILLVLTSRLFVALRWYILLRSGNVDMPFTRSVALTFTGLFANNFLPTTIGGDVVRLAGAMQMGYDRPVCLASIAADRLSGLIGNAFTLPFGLIPILQGAAAAPMQSVTVAALWSRAMEFGRRTMSTFAIWASKPFAVLGAIGCTWGHMLCTVLTMSTLIQSLGTPTNFWLIAGLWCVTYYVTLLPVSINGYGVQEFSLTYLLSRFAGVSTAASLTVAVLVRALYMVVSLVGAFYLPGILAAMDRSGEAGQAENKETLGSAG